MGMDAWPVAGAGGVLPGNLVGVGLGDFGQGLY